MLLVSLFCSVSSPAVHAYLDPGTGSYVIQLVAAFLFAALVFVKLSWNNIKLFVARRLKRKDAQGGK